MATEKNQALKAAGPALVGLENKVASCRPRSEDALKRRILDQRWQRMSW